jgi:hypothetical protein
MLVGAGVSVLGGAAVGRLVGNFGSVGDFALVTGIPGVLVVHAVNTAPTLRTTATVHRAVI